MKEVIVMKKNRRGVFEPAYVEEVVEDNGKNRTSLKIPRRRLREPGSSRITLDDMVQDLLEGFSIGMDYIEDIRRRFRTYGY